MVSILEQVPLYNAYLLHKVWQKSLRFVVTHSVVFFVGQHLKQNLEKFETFHVDGRVGIKETNGYPAKKKIEAAHGGIFEGRGGA